MALLWDEVEYLE